MIRKDDFRLGRTMGIGLWLIVIGLGIGILGFVMAVLSRAPVMMAMVGFGGLIFVIGLVLVGMVIFGGLRTEKKATTATQAFQMPDCQITARFATNAIGETIFSEDDIFFDDPKVKFFVRIQPSQGKQVELRTNVAVWQTCGEGMRGTAVVQGDWLGAFTHERGGGHGKPYG